MLVYLRRMVEESRWRIVPSARDEIQRVHGSNKHVINDASDPEYQTRMGLGWVGGGGGDARGGVAVA